MYCWGWCLDTVGPGSLAVPPCPCGANPLGCPRSGVAPGASRRAAGGTPPGCRLRRSTARGSGRAPSAGRMGYTRTRAPLCTWTSWWGCLTRKERETPWVSDSKKKRTFPGEGHGVVAASEENCGERHMLYVRSVPASVVKGGSRKRVYRYNPARIHSLIQLLLQTWNWHAEIKLNIRGPCSSVWSITLLCYGQQEYSPKDC